MLRPPSARGPNSIRPWSRPTTLPAARRSATAPGSCSRDRPCGTGNPSTRARPQFLRRVRGAEERARHAVRVRRQIRRRRGREVLALIRRNLFFLFSDPPRPPLLRALPRLAEVAVPDRERGADGAARVARRGLDPEVVEDPSPRSRPFATQFSATPPARQRYRAPVVFFACRAIFRTISSVTSWIERARSISRCVSSDSGSRAGPPKSRSKPAPVIVSRSAKSK